MDAEVDVDAGEDGTGMANKRKHLQLACSKFVSSNLNSAFG